MTTLIHQAAITALALCSACGIAAAQNYPSKPVRMIAPFPTGGGSDIVSRIIAQRLSEKLGQQVVVENRPGAAGLVGTESIARATPDGYTVGVVTSAALVLNPSLYKKIAYDPVQDFAPITEVAAYSYIVMAHASFPPKNFRELVAYAKANPGKINFASSGSSTLLAGASLKSLAGIQMTDIPFNGGAPALIQLLGGHVDVTMVSGLGPVQQHIKAGTIKPIAVTSLKRFTDLPEVPTIAESGMPGFDVSVWYGMVVPAATPRAIVATLNARIVAILKTPDVRERVLAAGSEVVASTPEEFAAFIKAEVLKWAKIVKDAGIALQ